MRQGATTIRNKKSLSVASRAKKRSLAAYISVFILVIAFVAYSYQDSRASGQPGNAAGASQALTKVPSNSPQSGNKVSVDQLTAASAVTDLAETVDLPTAGDLREAMTTLTIKKELAQNNTEVISKPQIIKPETSADRGIKSYVAKQGDDIESIARSFKISAQTLRWANNMTSDAVEVGKTLVVPMVNGVVYTVKDGDTVAKLAEKYKVSADRIVLYNDLTNDQPLPKDKQIVLPDGQLPEEEQPGYVAPRARRGATNRSNNNSRSSSNVSGASYSYARASVGNRYAPGNCTWYVYERRAALGRPIGSFWGNATSWAGSARSAGLVVNKTPTPGAIFQTSGGWGGYGHVGIVERVEGGRVFVSDMNFGGYNVVTHRELTNPGSYNYIH